MRRAVITGIGVVTPVGSTLASFWDNVRNGRSGIRRIQRFDPSAYPCQVAGEVRDFNLDAFIPRKEQRRMDPFSHYAIGATRMAVEDSSFDFKAATPERLGVVFGSGIGGISSLEEQHTLLTERGPSRCSPFMIPQMIINMAAGLIAIEYRCKGPNYAVVTACASAAHAIGDAMRLIRSDEADLVIAGGSEAPVTPLGLAGFSQMRALTSRNDAPENASRPFDAERDGFVMSDGSGMVIVEELEQARRRGARIYCEVAGFGMTCDAYHITAPAEDGEGAARAMVMAMKDGGVNPSDVDYINAHGTSTPLNDKTETRAIKTAFGDAQARRLMVSSTKSVTGHLLGAAGGVEAAVCALAIRDGVVPPTINHEHPDPDCDLDCVPNTARECPLRVCLSNSLGFGGHNACLLFKRLD